MEALKQFVWFKLSRHPGPCTSQLVLILAACASGALLGIGTGKRWCSRTLRKGGLGGGGAAVAYNKVYDFMRSSKSKRGRSGRRKEGKEAGWRRKVDLRNHYIILYVCMCERDSVAESLSLSLALSFLSLSVQKCSHPKIRNKFAKI